MSNIFDIIKEKALQQEDAVPADAWSNIVEKRRKRRPAFWIPIAAVLSGFILWGTYMMWKDDASMKPGQAQVETGKSDHILNENEGDPAKGSQTVPGHLQSAQAQESTENTLTTGISESKSHPVISSNSPDAKTRQQVALLDETRPGQKINAGVTSDATVTDKREKRSNRKSSKSRTRMTVESPVQESDLAVTKDKNKQQADNSTAVQDISVSDAGIAKADITAASEPAEKENVPVKPATVADKPASPTQETKEVKPVSQEKKKNKDIKPTGWYAEAIIMPVMPFSDMPGTVNFSRTVQSLNNKAEFNGNMSRARLMPSVAYQVGARKNISRRLSLGLGVQYLRMKEDIRITGLQTNTMITVGNEHPGYLDGLGMVRDTTVTYLSSSRQFRFVNSYQVISLPVSVQYWLSQKSRWSYAVEGGLNLAFSTRYENHVNENLISPLVSSKPVSNQSTRMNMSVFTGLRVQRTINSRMSAFALPMIQVSPATQQVNRTYIDRRIHRAAIGFGLSVGL